jgi:hypothetical protein
MPPDVKITRQYTGEICRYSIMPLKYQHSKIKHFDDDDDDDDHL